MSHSAHNASRETSAPPVPPQISEGNLQTIDEFHSPQDSFSSSEENLADRFREQLREFRQQCVTSGIRPGATSTPQGPEEHIYDVPYHGQEASYVDMDARDNRPPEIVSRSDFRSLLETLALVRKDMRRLEERRETPLGSGERGTGTFRAT